MQYRNFNSLSHPSQKPALVFTNDFSSLERIWKTIAWIKTFHISPEEKYDKNSMEYILFEACCTQLTAVMIGVKDIFTNTNDVHICHYHSYQYLFLFQFKGECVLYVIDFDSSSYLDGVLFVATSLFSCWIGWSPLETYFWVSTNTTTLYCQTTSNVQMFCSLLQIQTQHTWVHCDEGSNCFFISFLWFFSSHYEKFIWSIFHLFFFLEQFFELMKFQRPHETLDKLSKESVGVRQSACYSLLHICKTLPELMVVSNFGVFGTIIWSLIIVEFVISFLQPKLERLVTIVEELFPTVIDTQKPLLIEALAAVR